MREFDKALLWHKKALKVDPDECATYSDMGHVYLMKKDYVNFEKMWGESLERDPKYQNLNNYYQYGHSLFWVNRI